MSLGQQSTPRSEQRPSALINRTPSPQPARPTTRNLRNLGKRGLRTLFEMGQRLGVSILPRHFYSEVPHISALRRDSNWRDARRMTHVAGADTQTQLDFVARCCTPERVQRLRNARVHELACDENGAVGYGRTEADFLYAFIQQVQPTHVIQVGCGVSTSIILRAARDAGHNIEVTCIDPFPTAFLKSAADKRQIRLIAKPAQDLPLSFFDELQEGGLLFVDSSHVVGPGSEVNLLVLDVIPMLRRGHWIHFHDIYFPYDYQRGLLDGELFFSNESALLLALLADNPRLTIRASLSMLHYGAASDLMRLLPNYSPAGNDHGLHTTDGDFPSSIFLEVVG